MQIPPEVPLSSPLRERDVEPRGVYWGRYRIDGRWGLYFVTAAGAWYGHFFPFPGESEGDAETRIWSMLDMCDPPTNYPRPDLRVI